MAGLRIYVDGMAIIGALGFLPAGMVDDAMLGYEWISGSQWLEWLDGVMV